MTKAEIKQIKQRVRIERAEMAQAAAAGWVKAARQMQQEAIEWADATPQLLAWNQRNVNAAYLALVRADRALAKAVAA